MTDHGSSPAAWRPRLRKPVDADFDTLPTVSRVMPLRYAMRSYRSGNGSDLIRLRRKYCANSDYTFLFGCCMEQQKRAVCFNVVRIVIGNGGAVANEKVTHRFGTGLLNAKSNGNGILSVER